MRKLADLERERVHRQDGDDEQSAPAHVTKNYITPAGYARLTNELQELLDRVRPELVKTIAWAASNGDRSENADYIYGKRRLREIDRRIRHLNKRLEIAAVVDPARAGLDRIFFGATVTYREGGGVLRTISIVGQDEVDPARGLISWVSPAARALNQARVGDVVKLKTPAGMEALEIVEVRYVALPDQ